MDNTFFFPYTTHNVYYTYKTYSDNVHNLLGQTSHALRYVWHYPHQCESHYVGVGFKLAKTAKTHTMAARQRKYFGVNPSNGLQ